MSSRQPRTEFPIVLLKNLPFEANPTDIYSLCSKFGNVIQIRRGTESHLKGNCFVVYDDLKASKLAIEHLSGFNFQGRYLVALLYMVDSISLEAAKEKLNELQSKD